MTEFTREELTLLFDILYGASVFAKETGGDVKKIEALKDKIAKELYGDIE